MSMPLHPVAFGHWDINANRLQCRLPRKTVTVTAPGELLRGLRRLCDGRTAWREVAAALARSWAGNAVDPFLRQLAQEGLLVEAADVSPATFADEALPRDALCKVLASAYPLLAARCFVFVLRPLPCPGGAQEPGLYEALFSDGRVSLKALGVDVHGAWRLLQDPRVLRYASALLLPVRAHASRHAGPPAEGAQWLAGVAGVAANVLGDTRTDRVLALLAPFLAQPQDHCVVLPAIVVGAAPSAHELTLAARDAWMQVQPANVPRGQSDPCSGFAFSAGPVFVGDMPVRGMGRSDDPRLAMRKAEAEAWERRGWATLGRVQEGRMREIEGALAPTDIVAFTTAQYASPGFPLHPFSPRARYLWTPATQVRTGRVLQLPAECVYARVTLPRRLRARACASTSTSGVAAWTDADGALCAATLELIERDAFARSWLAGRPAPLLLPDTVPRDAQQRVAGLEALGHRVALARIAVGPVPVMAAFVQHRERPFTAITTAADFDPEAALAKALDEAEARAAHAAAYPARPLARASQVRGIEDVNRYYQTPKFHRRADFYAAGPACERFSAARACRNWPELQAWLGDHGFDLLAADLTPAGAAVDQGRSPLRVMRALIPGLIPIWFGYGLQPAGLRAFAAAQARGALAGGGQARFIHPFT